MSTALVLLLGPLIWGLGFVATKMTLTGSGPLWANGVRFVLASAVLLPMAFVRVRRLGARQLGAGALLGVFLFLAFSFQTAGMVTTSISHSSFITGLYAVFVPALGPLFGRHPRPALLGSAALALIGLALLTGLASASARPTLGDALILGCAVTSAIHILIADRVAKAIDSIALNWVQLATVAACSIGVACAIEGGPQIRWSPSVVWGQLYLAIFSSGVAFTLQFWAQRRISPTVAAMIFLLEAPFGAAAGALWYHERLSGLQMTGALMMLAASYLAIVTGEREPEASEPEVTALRETGL
jgi:drug/metabolite transporter (DMT)-like permease